MKKNRLHILILLVLILVFNLTSCNNSNSSDDNTGSDIIRKEPYLIYTGNNTSMTVTWQTIQTPGSSKIEWGSGGPVPEGSVDVKENGSGADEHIFTHTITGLKPDSLVYYRVIVDGKSYGGSFRTAPDELADTLSFYTYGDTRSHPDVQNQVTGRILSDMKAYPAKRQTFITHSGDFTMDGMDEGPWDNEYFNREYPATVELLASLPVLTSCGNHETYRADFVDDPENYGWLLRKYWPYTFLEDKGHCYYSVDYGPLHIAVIDQYTTDYQEGSVQYQWLKQDLENSKKKWKIVMFHRPGWSAGVAGESSSSKSIHENDEIIQKYYHPIFRDNNVKVVLQGHVHYYARCSVDGIAYLTLGGGGAPLTDPDLSSEKLVKALKMYHFGRIDIDGNEMNVTIINDSGNEIDSLKLEL